MPALKTKDEFMNRIKARIGEDLTDDDITFIEDMSDTYDEVSKNATIDYKEQYEKLKGDYDSLDKSWKEKYTARFFGGEPMETPEDVKEEQKEDVIDDAESVDYEDLFEEREG